MSEIKNYLETQIADLQAKNERHKQAIKNLENEIATRRYSVEGYEGLISQNNAIIVALSQINNTAGSSEPRDNRPDGWTDGYAFYVPSRSRHGKGHEICGAYREKRVGPYADSYDWSCNCEWGKFKQEPCWAVKAVKENVSRFKQLPAGSKRMWAKGRTNNPATEYGPDFGLAKWDDEE